MLQTIFFKHFKLAYSIEWIILNILLFLHICDSFWKNIVFWKSNINNEMSLCTLVHKYSLSLEWFWNMYQN